jgi:molybdopterin molybdotransferase/putative molybdopterin biosynthesis protein
VKAGTTLRPLQLCLLAAGGILNLPVIKKPTVAYIPTGNELIPVSATPQRGQNIESNGAMIGGFLSEWGANIRAYPIIRDDSRLLEETLNDALQNADIVLINGGSSMGSQDYTIDLLERRGSFLQHGIKSIPGIPVALAIVEGKPIINLPGPPFAAFCVMDWCVRALVCKYKGQTIPRRQTREVVLSQAVHKPVPYDFYLRLHICKLSNGYEALPLPFGSRFAKAMNCNGLTVIPIGVDGYEKGSVVEAELLYGEADLPLVTEG